MIVIPGITVKTKIYESDRSLVYQGIRECDRQEVIFKILKIDYPLPKNLVSYQQEYELIKSLNIPGVIKAYSIEKCGNTLAIVFEDFGGESLKTLLSKEQLNINNFLKIAIKIIEALAQLHSLNIIHKNLNPANIVLNAQTGEIKIIDFGIATVLTSENNTIKNPNNLEADLSYISPEQTGRMSRSLDYRTDFYSIGVTFYQLLTNSLPFNTKDAMELVHCHLAITPKPPRKLQPEIPLVLSSIVMKLLAKTPEERYQSAGGIKADLEKCLEQLEDNGLIQMFPLCTADISDKFQVIQKLYGRENESKTLIAAFEKLGTAIEQKTALNQSEIVLVSGYSGIGKTTLVQVLYRPITRYKGYFITGKFDQYQRNIPYSAIVSAFGDLVQQLLTESEVQLQSWKTKIITALGNNAQVIVDEIPDLKKIIGEQPTINNLPPLESSNRFNLVFKNFISIFTNETPLILFLDDLQWADLDSLKLIKLLLSTSNNSYLFLVGAYRFNEINATHPLHLTINEITKEKIASISLINLSPLTLNDINHLIADSFKCSLADCLSLAQLVNTKTQGNPFFINEFLYLLYTENLLSFDNQIGKWQWNINKIQAQDITDNVVELMVNKIQKLPLSTQNLLKIAAAIGNLFGREMLAIVANQTLLETNNHLLKAVAVGLIFSLDDKVCKIVDTDLLKHLGIECEYKFSHDKIRQSAYSLISEQDKPRVHLQVGKFLLKHTSIKALEQKIFDIVNQLNLGSKLISLQSQQIDIARLNLIAAKKAKATAAYQPAYEYLKTGLILLPKSSWKSCYELTLSLYLEAAEIAYLSTNFEQMRTLAAVIMQQARSLNDKIKIYEVLIQAAEAQNEFKAAIQIALEALNLLGINLPEYPNKLQVMLALWKMRIILAFKKNEQLIALPLMIEPNKIAAMNILAKVSTAAYITNPKLFFILIIEQVKLSLVYGNSLNSPFAYAQYSLILVSRAKNISGACKMGQVALKLINKLNIVELAPKTKVVIYAYLNHWENPLNQTLKPALELHYKALEVGDLAYSGYAINTYSFYAYFCGKDLVTLEKEMVKYSQVLHRIGQSISLHQNKLYRQVILNLLGQAENPCKLRGEAYDEDIMFLQHQQANDRTTIFYFYFHKLILCYLFGEDALAVENADLAREYLNGVIGSLFETLFYFYESLAKLAIYDRLGKLSQQSLLKQVTITQKKLEKWAHYSPTNYLHKFYLVTAEIYRVQGQNDLAIEYYDRAVDQAKINNYINEEALAQELTAKFYLQQKKEAIAKAYMREAVYYYTIWGATAKVADLKTRYPQLISKSLQIPVQEILLNQFELETSTVASSESLDLATVTKASQAISSEIAFDQLLVKLIEIAIENAGAQSGTLILEADGELLIEAAAISSEIVAVRQSLPVLNSDCLPKSIINYVARTLESVLLNDATDSGLFIKDPYIIKYQIKSVLCVPIQSQNQLRGILYLENNLINGAFTLERLTVLKVLCSQAAISIDNARLYEVQANYSRNLELKVIERTQELQHSQLLLSSVLDSSIDGIMAFKSIRDNRGSITDFEWLLVNPTAEYIVKRTANELIGKHLLVEMPTNRDTGLFDFYVRVVETTKPQEQELYYDDGTIQAWFQIVAVKLGDGFAATFRDITERKQAEAAIQKANQDLKRLAVTDGLTQIANRRQFDEYLNLEWQRLERENETLALIVCDIDYFKLYNDTYGHQAGDECLRVVAKAISRAIKRPADLVARYGGEEFAVVLPHTDELGAIAVAENIAEEIQQSKVVHNTSAVSEYITLSIGIASTIPSSEYAPEVLFAVADKGLYEAKKQGRNRAVAKKLLPAYLLEETSN
ncbi:diguanylate cyclase domain-containing protein [Synechocystis sp. PCC 7509]|uniref:diguanylate cyclase domain-containing protein n=1 Tax=Synechocystis sp. PCC 7509 TaxID=927677 RepID=UPI0002AC2380|nr:diguanylate cyclase [Synechocystis sp. PCC 7509]